MATRTIPPALPASPPAPPAAGAVPPVPALQLITLAQHYKLLHIHLGDCTTTALWTNQDLHFYRDGGGDPGLHVLTRSHWEQRGRRWCCRHCRRLVRRSVQSLVGGAISALCTGQKWSPSKLKSLCCDLIDKSVTFNTFKQPVTNYSTKVES